MMSSLGGQKSRPKVQTQQQRNPLNQQQRRAFDTAWMGASNGNGNVNANTSSRRPASQIEALPPSQLGLLSSSSPFRQATATTTTHSNANPRSNQHQHQHPTHQTLPSNTKTQSTSTSQDPTKRHPVFFTDRLHKPPSGVGDGWVGGMSPVARGYVFNDGGVGRGGGIEREARL